MADDGSTKAKVDKALVAELAAQLGERDTKPLMQLRRIVECCGVEQARAWVAETERIEAAGGEMLPDGSRRRTKGGVFFRMVRSLLSGSTKRYVFPPLKPSERRNPPPKQPKRPKQQQQPKQPKQPPKPISWDERDELIIEGQQHIGKATTVKITVIGRPSKAVERQGFTLLVLEHEGKLGSFPKGIPVPPQPMPTQYIVYVGGKQWTKVKGALENAEDLLIIEGVPVMDPKYNAITVFATNTTTKLLQQGKRKAVSETAGPGASETAGPGASEGS